MREEEEGINMDSILFYGEKDEATRRQVRSAAAQHSHRIGPRKPKATKRPRADSENSRRRTLQAATAIAAAPIAPGSAGKLTPARGPTTSTTKGFCQGPVLGDYAATDKQSSHSRSPATSDQEQEPQSHVAYAQWGHNRPQGQQPVLSPGQHSSLHPPLPSLQVPAPPPLSIERIDRAKEVSPSNAQSRSDSKASSQSPTMRLPQYSWTEYPRYGLSHNSLPSASLQMLPQVAADGSASGHSLTPTPPPGAAGFSVYQSQRSPALLSYPTFSSAYEQPPHQQQAHTSTPLIPGDIHQRSVGAVTGVVGSRTEQHEPRISHAISLPDPSIAKPKLQPG